MREIQISNLHFTRDCPQLIELPLRPLGATACFLSKIEGRDGKNNR